MVVNQTDWATATVELTVSAALLNKYGLSSPVYVAALIKEEFSFPYANRVPVEKVWGIGDKEERKVFYFLEIRDIVISIN